jgi:hypothetical protein
MPSDGISLLTMLLVAAFAIERIGAGILFLLGMLNLLADPEAYPDPVKRAAVKRKYVFYHFLVSAALVILVLLYVGDFRFLDALGLGNRADLSRVPPWLDHLLLGVVLIGGAEQMSAFLKMVGAPASGAGDVKAQSVEVSGKLTLEEPPARK